MSELIVRMIFYGYISTVMYNVLFLYSWGGGRPGAGTTMSRHGDRGQGTERMGTDLERAKKWFNGGTQRKK